jgi:hypothetical protein
MDLSPIDDPVVQCEVRLWFDQRVTVFVNPRNWRQISITGRMPLLISSCGVTFSCVVASCGEHHRSGSPKDIGSDDFGVETLGDYPGLARIDWPAALPDLLLARLEESPELLATWQTLSCQEMRTRLSFVLRARNPGTVAARQLALLRRLTELGAKANGDKKAK